jgi:multiple antibiotic resistance protein
VPLLAGPAAFSYVMGNSAWHTSADLIHVVVPILLVGIACWVTFYMACQAEKKIRQSTLDVVQRVGGFILAAIAVEMMATGLRGLFPMLAPG